MATKVKKEVYEAIRNVRTDAIYYEIAGIVTIGQRNRRKTEKTVLVMSAGTSDLPIAEEAAVTAEVMGNTVERLYDVGVAGVHRFFDNRERLFHANVIIVVAGMEGALASIVGGLADKPVVAVPTSVGYGASFGGLAALLTMLNCCAPGVVVVNIDNGFGAGYFASNRDAPLTWKVYPKKGCTRYYYKECAESHISHQKYLREDCQEVLWRINTCRNGCDRSTGGCK